jgi:hypothetical protein
MPPFYADDPMDTYERILSEEFKVRHAGVALTAMSVDFISTCLLQVG